MGQPCSLTRAGSFIKRRSLRRLSVSVILSRCVTMRRCICCSNRGERGSGLVFASACPTDVLDLSWQRLILTHLGEKTHIGVLTGAPVTDMKITLLTGRAHVKHTEGGDFREATYRAVRQGLMQADSMLLEPYYAFRLEVPESCVGRAMSDIQRLDGSFEIPESKDGRAVLTGKAPVSTLRDYWTEVAAYTRGEGRLSCELSGYEPCHNAAEVISAAAAYDAAHDVENTPDSVFCSHGAGHVVKWDEVPAQAHLDSGLRLDGGKEQPDTPPTRQTRSRAGSGLEEDAELRALFERTYGPIKDRGIRGVPAKPQEKRHARAAVCDPHPRG